jgi:hypothetical protein
MGDNGNNTGGYLPYLRYLLGADPKTDTPTIKAQWCIHNETGEQVLLDLKTGEVITTWDDLHGRKGHKAETREM